MMTQLIGYGMGQQSATGNNTELKDCAYFEAQGPLIDASRESCGKQNLKNRKRIQLHDDLTGDKSYGN